MEGFISAFAGADPSYLNVYISIMRYLMPILVLLLLIRCGKPLLSFRREPESWAWLCLADGNKIPVTHWENVIGRSKGSDICIDFSTVSRIHAVLTRYDDGSWTLTDAGSKAGVRINGEAVNMCVLHPGDKIEIGGVPMTLQPISAKQEKRLAQLRTKGSGVFRSIGDVALLTVVQLLMAVGFLLSGTDGRSVILGFSGILVAQWLLLLLYIGIRRTAFEVETIAFFLCTMGMAAICAVKPGEAFKQLIALYGGIGLFLGVGGSLRKHSRAQKCRYIAAVAGVAFLVITLVFGKEYYGAKNWLVIGSLSLQPSELSKVCFVYAGTAAMHRLISKGNLLRFIAYSIAICGCLALMNDFGTALIFFCAFLIIAFLRSGSVGTIALACTSLGFAGVLALKIAPHAMRRFAAWRHVWEYPLTSGYQQTRALMCISAGGLFGLGAGQGWMKNLFAADSDVVFATLSEEWGLLTVLMMVACILVLGLFVLRSAAVSRSSLYTISACAAAGILLTQCILNGLGTVDVVPLTGVTFPFVSNGGSSMLGSWGLLAFIKAVDTRQNASFAVPLAPKRRDTDE